MKGCKSNINRFCYCCGKYVAKSVKKGTFSAEFIEAYEKYFSQRVVLQKCWVPNIVCKNCYNRLIDWTNGKRKCMQFGVPMIWTHPGPVHKKENCYACANKGAALRKKERKSFKYVEVQSAQTPLPHSGNIPAPQCPSPTILSTTTFESFIPDNHKDPEYNLCVSNQPILVSQSKLDSLVAKLELTQRKSEELASFLRSQNLLAEDVRVTVYRSRQSTMQSLFVVNGERTSAYCPDVEKLMDAMNIINYKAEDWILFIDSSKCSLKAILLHKTNEKPSIPIAYSTETKETYEALENILKMVEYSKHRWRICCDLKVVAILSGLQSGYVKHMCFICDWDSRYSGNQYACHDWKQREDSKFAMANIIRKPLVPKDNILLPPLHIKLGLVKNFIKTIAKRNDVLLCLKEIYLRLSESKIKEAKSLPLHCVVESVHSLQASLAIDSRNPWKRRTNIETDSYVIMAAATPWSELVQTALQRLGYSQEAANTARGSIMIKNWKPIPLEIISDNPVVPVSDIIGELTSVITLRIVILRSKPSSFGEIKDKLLKLLVLQSHTVLRSTGCPLDEMTLSQICRSSYQNPYAFPAGEISDELRRKFDQWWSQQLTPQSNIAPKILPFLAAPTSAPNEMDFPVGSAAVAAAAAAAAAAQAGLHAASGVGNVPGNNMPGLSTSRETLLMNDAAHHGPQSAQAPHHPNMLVHPAMHPSMHHHHHHHPHSQYPNQKTRMRTSFDPEMELPKLQKWFQENPHPSRQQIQTYVVQLNALESRRGRKPLDVNNVVYWFKNARAAQKRAEMRGGLAALGHPSLNGFVLNQHGQMGQSSSSSGGSQQLSSSNINLAMSHDYLKSPLSLKSEDVDTMSQHSDDMDEDNSRPGSPQLPLSLTTHERNRNSPFEGGDANMELGDSRCDVGGTDGSLKEEAACQAMLNGSLNQSIRSSSRSYNEEDAQVQGKQNEPSKCEDPQGDNSNENVTSGEQNNTDHNNSNNNNNDSGMNNTNSNNNNSNNSNNNNNNEPSCDAVVTQAQISTSPKMNSPKEEDDDLDLEDDDDDNDNDASQLDEFRSPSPDLANAMAQRKDLPFPMVPNSMFSQSFMYMSHYIPGFGQAAANHPHAHHAAAAAAAAGMPPNALMNPSGLSLSSMSNEERRKRNRTFIDPVTEVPKLEQWFAMNTHPSHNLILKYTEDLNTMPYRQKFPRLESKNVQFWFKNRRAKCKRLKMSLYDSSQLQGLNSFVSKYEERD